MRRRKNGLPLDLQRNVLAVPDTMHAHNALVAHLHARHARVREHTEITLARLAPDVSLIGAAANSLVNVSLRDVNAFLLESIVVIHMLEAHLLARGGAVRRGRPPWKSRSSSGQSHHDTHLLLVERFRATEIR